MSYRKQVTCVDFTRIPVECMKMQEIVKMRRTQIGDNWPCFRIELKNKRLICSCP